MSLFVYGPRHRWFAWRPVNTVHHGWKWLVPVWRNSVRLNAWVAPGPNDRFWEYYAITEETL